MRLKNSQVNRRDAKSAEADHYQPPDRISLKGDWYAHPLLPSFLCTAIDQFDRSLRATSQTKGTAEYAEYAENGMDWVPTSAYFAYSAVSVAALPHCALRVSAVHLCWPRLHGHG